MKLMLRRHTFIATFLGYTAEGRTSDIAVRRVIASALRRWVRS